VLSWISADVLQLSFTNRSSVVALLVATAEALLFGGVLGALHGLSSANACQSLGSDGSWPTSDRRYLGWLFVIMPGPGLRPAHH
jgi:hypothetical protein